MWYIHFGHLLQRSWALFKATEGTSTVGFVSTILSTLLTIGCVLFFSWRRGRRKGVSNEWKENALVDLMSLPVVLVVVYGPALVWSLCATVYADHQFLVNQNSELQVKQATVQSELDDRKRNLHLTDPATGR